MDMLGNLKIGTKMITSFVVILILLLAVVGISYGTMTSIGMELMYVDRLIPINQLGNSNTAFFEQRGDLFKFILVPTERIAIKQDIDSQYALIEANMSAYQTSYLAQSEKDELAKFEVAWLKYQKTVNDILTGIKAGETEAAIASLSDGGALFNARVETAAILSRLIDINTKLAHDLNTQADATLSGSTWAMGILSVFSILMALVVGILLTRNIALPIANMAKVAQRVGDGDLTVSLPVIDRKDEIGILSRAFRRMIDQMFSATTDINLAIVQLGSTVSEILAFTTQVASGTVETAASISETTTTVEEVRQAAQLSAQKAQDVSDSAQRVSQVSQSGQKSVEETSVGMKHTKEQIDTIAQTIVRLNEQSQSIGGITALVMDIASQSNLLAVNAAIEAAKAGEQGRGFTVVAQEIKSLAEQSRQATAQVRGILNDVQKAIGYAVIATEQGSKAVEAGIKQASQAGEAIRDLSETSNDAVRAAVQIVESSQQQVVGMDQIGIAMENINQAGAQNAGSMKQMEIAARNLHQMGLKLKELIDQFKI